MLAATRALCAPNVFYTHRASYTNSQPTLGLGKAMVERGHKKAVWISWKYAAKRQGTFEGFKQSYTAAGGTIVQGTGPALPQRGVPGPAHRDCGAQARRVACFFAGGGAVEFIKDYAAAGLKDKIPLYGSGFLTEGVLDAAEPGRRGVITAMHYADSLNTPRDNAFRLEYAKAFRSQPDVYAMQGYDTGLLLIQGAQRRQGRPERQASAVQGAGGATIDSPRGKWTMSKAHNPIQDIYLRRVENKENKVISVAAKALADSGAGCRLG